MSIKRLWRKCVSLSLIIINNLSSALGNMELEIWKQGTTAPLSLDFISIEEWLLFIYCNIYIVIVKCEDLFFYLINNNLICVGLWSCWDHVNCEGWVDVHYKSRSTIHVLDSSKSRHYCFFFGQTNFVLAIL